MVRNFYYLPISFTVFIFLLFFVPEVSFLVFAIMLAFFYKGQYILRFFKILLLNIRKFAIRSVKRCVSYFFSPTLPWIEDQKNTVFKRAVGGTTQSIANNLRSPLRKGYECLRLGIKKTKIETNRLSSDIGRSSEKNGYIVNLLNIGSIDFGKNTNHYSFILSAAARELGCAVNTGEPGLTSGLLRGGADLIWRLREKDFTGYNNMEDALDDKVFIKTLSRSYIKMIEIEIPLKDLFKDDSILNLDRLIYFLEKLKAITRDKPIGISLRSPDKHQLEAIFENVWLRDLRIDFINIEEKLCSAVHGRLKVLTDIEESFLKSVNAAKETIRYFGIVAKRFKNLQFSSTLNKFDCKTNYALYIDLQCIQKAFQQRNQ